ncbi:MAG: hypothetical protein ABMB14_11120 [Myxococcota bacterium]
MTDSWCAQPPSASPQPQVEGFVAVMAREPEREVGAVSELLEEDLLDPTMELGARMGHS